MALCSSVARVLSYWFNVRCRSRRPRRQGMFFLSSSIHCRLRSKCSVTPRIEVPTMSHMRFSLPHMRFPLSPMRHLCQSSKVGGRAILDNLFISYFVYRNTLLHSPQNLHFKGKYPPRTLSSRWEADSVHFFQGPFLVLFFHNFLDGF